MYKHPISISAFHRESEKRIATDYPYIIMALASATAAFAF
jgi:hypothetical protein